MTETRPRRLSAITASLSAPVARANDALEAKVRVACSGRLPRQGVRHQDQ